MKLALRRGLLVLIALAILTVVEFIVPAVLGRNALPFLVVFALAKAALIIHYFMHIAQLWRQEE
jgi:caa(3)-type oxidase subunit IV